MGRDKVDAAIENVDAAPIDDKLRATLKFLKKVTREHAAVTPQDVEALLALGVTRSQVEDALAVSWCFNVITRLADTFKFEIGPQAAFDASAKSLLSRGYKL
jgi:alkylhydroperoxidase family enzyme